MKLSLLVLFETLATGQPRISASALGWIRISTMAVAARDAAIKIMYAEFRLLVPADLPRPAYCLLLGLSMSGRS